MNKYKRIYTAITMFLLMFSQCAWAEGNEKLPDGPYTVTILREDLKGNVLNKVVIPAMRSGGGFDAQASISIGTPENPKYWLVEIQDKRIGKAYDLVQVDVGDSDVRKADKSILWLYVVRGLPDKSGRMVVYSNLKERLIVIIEPSLIPSK
ncbi:hypothetical protein NT6N_24180 [Oceaniferula spumae]|uniref:Uncharacterized protein n=1 Tax=Oceaniferula spumae TaxID=2979115 RepID=A0AAT9FN50_9BACT